VSPGRFVTFEGLEGAGKTTQARRLAERLEALGQPVVLTREPGGTELGDQVRALVLPAGGLAITARAETLLYCVARAQLVESVLRPALARGEVAIVDRYADSTLAYQAAGRGLPFEGVRAVLEFATGGLQPDLTVLLDLPAETGLGRKRAQAAGNSADWNRFEAEALEFHQHVRAGYLALAGAQPDRWLVVDASSSPQEIAEQIWQAFRGRTA
jgi:dTMP kinase